MTKLRNMLPCFASKHQPDGCAANTNLQGDGSCANTRHMESTNEADLIIVQFRRGEVYTFGLPALSGFVSHVFNNSTEKEVVGAAARRLIASMQNILLIGDRPVGKFIGNAVRFQPLTSVHDTPVAVKVAVALPKPAPIGAGQFLHVLPEMHGKGSTPAVAASITTWLPGIVAVCRTCSGPKGDRGTATAFAQRCHVHA